MKRLIRYLKMLYIVCCKGGYARAKLLKKYEYFKKQGENCFFQPWNFGSEPYLISFGNNVHIASGVTFVNHDVTAYMFQNMDNKKYKMRYGEIKIGDNVFVGTNSTILYDVKIGNNVIIGAGSLVNKSIPDGVIVGGVPCKIIGKFDDYKKRIEFIDNM